MADFTVQWIPFALLTVFVSENNAYSGGGYISQRDTRCVQNKCIRFMGMKKSYEQAESACRQMFQGRLANYRDGGDGWIKAYLDRQMQEERKNEIWIGAKLVNQGGNGYCGVLRGDYGSNSATFFANVRCREQRGILCTINASGDCPPGFLQCGTKCLKHLTGAYTWQSARQHCKEVGGTGLLEFDSFADNENLFSCYPFPLAPGEEAWVKGSEENEEEIQWSDGSIFNPESECSDWKDYEPYGPDSKKCVSYYGRHGWKTRPCEKKLDFACEYPHQGESPMPDRTQPPEDEEYFTTEAPVEMTPESGSDDGNEKTALIYGIISLGAVLLVSIVVIVVILVIMKKRKSRTGKTSHLEKAGSCGSVQSNTFSTRYLVEPTAPDASKINPVEKKISTTSNYYESVDDVPRKSPGYQDLQNGHYQYDHPYTDLDFTEEQNRRNERMSPPPESPSAYDEPYADKRRLRPIADSNERTNGKVSRQPSPGPRHVTFGGIETPLAKVLSNSPKEPRRNSPKTTPKPLPKIPRPSVGTKAPLVAPSKAGKSNVKGAEPKNQSAPPVYAEPSDQDSVTTYNQSQHSYLELLQDATPEELAAVKANERSPSPKGKNSPKSHGGKPSSGKDSPKGDANVKQKAKALESKFKLSTSPTLGRQKLTDGKYTSVVDGDVYKQ